MPVLLFVYYYLKCISWTNNHCRTSVLIAEQHSSFWQMDQQWSKVIAHLTLPQLPAARFGVNTA